MPTVTVTVTLRLVAEHPRPDYRRVWEWTVRVGHRPVAAGTTHSRLTAEHAAATALRRLEGRA